MPMHESGLPDNVERALEGILMLPAYEQAALRVIASPLMAMPGEVKDSRTLMRYQERTLKKLPLPGRYTFGDFQNDMTEEGWLGKVEAMVSLPMFKRSYRSRFKNGISDDSLEKVFKETPPGTRVGQWQFVGIVRINGIGRRDSFKWALPNEEVQIWRNVEVAEPLIH